MKRWLTIALVLVACERKQTELLEQTATEIGDRTVAATSADGRFVVEFSAGALRSGSTLYITTRRDLMTAQRLASLVYEVTVEPAQQPVEPGRLSYRPVGNDTTDLRFVRFDDVDAATLSVLADSRASGTSVTATFDVLPSTFAVNRRQRLTCADFTCGAPCTLCDEQGVCTATGYESTGGICLADPAQCCVDDRILGAWQAPVGSGLAFIVDRLELAREGTGFDLDGQCGQASCVDNVLGLFADAPEPFLPVSEASLLLVEAAGLPQFYRGEAYPVVKLYQALDADDDPSNDFMVPPGETSCCAFNIAPTSISGIPPQARARLPGLIQRGQFRSQAPVVLHVQRTDIDATLRMERVFLSARFPDDLATLDAGLLGGYVPVRDLATFPSDQTPTLDRFVALGRQPDGDLDFDGLECLLDRSGDGRIDTCCDGVLDGPACDAVGCLGDTIPPVVAGDPGSCVMASELADGYSAGFSFTAVAATIVGTAD